MASEIRANSITSRAGLSTVTMTDSGPMFSGITTFVDNSGFTFGVGGGTSIFTPATNILTLGTNNTEKVRIDANGNANITGVTTAANFKTGVSNLHNAGLTLSGGQIDVGSNIKIGTAGVITATTFHGSGANLTGISQVGGATGVDFSDDILVRFGNANDLQLYHNSSTTANYIDSHNGRLYIRGSSNEIKIQSVDGEEGIIVKPNGATELYHDNVISLETTTEGIEIKKTASGRTARLQIESTNGGQAGIELRTSLSGTNRAARIDMYNQNTLQWSIFNDYQQNGTNDFSVRHGAEIAIRALPDDVVELYHNNTKMFSTASDGVQLHGDTKISRTPNGNGAILAVTNAQYAKALFIGGWDNGTNSSGISRIRNSNDNLHIDSGSLGQIYLNAYSSGVIYARHFRPMANNTYDIGGNGIRWDDIFATNGTINTSDRNEKNTITESDLGLSFINKLKPVSYKFNNGTRTHYGLIAQDIETVLSDINKPSTDFAGFIKTDLPDEYYQEAEPNIPEGKKEGDLKSAAHTEYGLRYTEFISPLIKAIQEQQEQIKTLEQDIITLRVRVTNLEGN